MFQQSAWNSSCSDAQKLSNSPDINPIENLWAILKNRVEKQVNKLLVKKKAITKDFFREIIQKEWDRVETEIVNLARSMPRRLEEIVARNGNKINY